MSEKLFDPLEMLDQVRPDASARDRRLFEMRLAEEYEAERKEQQAKDPILGRPAMPDAQLVFNASTNTAGVAIRGAKFICTLPKGYGGPGCELALIDGGRMIVVQPDHAPLLIDPQTGTTRRL
jgi:hypothetical protein